MFGIVSWILGVVFGFSIFVLAWVWEKDKKKAGQRRKLEVKDV